MITFRQWTMLLWSIILTFALAAVVTITGCTTTIVPRLVLPAVPAPLLVPTGNLITLPVAPAKSDKKPNEQQDAAR